jgi:hypothetical protein
LISDRAQFLNRDSFEISFSEAPAGIDRGVSRVGRVTFDRVANTIEPLAISYQSYH